MKNLKNFEMFEGMQYATPGNAANSVGIVFVSGESGSPEKMKELVNQMGGQVKIIDAEFVNPNEVERELKDSETKGEKVVIIGRDKASNEVNRILLGVKTAGFIDLEFCTLEDIKRIASKWG